MEMSIITRILPHAKVRGHYVSLPTSDGVAFLLEASETSAQVEAWGKDYMEAMPLLSSSERRTLCDLQKAKYLDLRRREAA